MMVALSIMLCIVIGWCVILYVVLKWQTCKNCPFYEHCKQLNDKGEQNLCAQNNMNYSK